MNKKIISLAMLFVQMFLTSETIHAVETESIETGKGNLCPADNSGDK